MPNVGQNCFAFIILGSYVNWFWSDFCIRKKQLTGNKNKRQLFVYQGLSTFADMVNARRPMSLQSIKWPIYVHAYGSHSSLIGYLTFMFRQSPVGLALKVVRGFLRRRAHQVPIPKLTPSAVVLAGTSFVPVGGEWLFFASSIDLGAMPFPVEQIE
jgi:hypothetical protein